MPFDQARRAFVTRTYGEFIAGGYSITAYCYRHECGHAAALDLQKFAGQFGPNADFRKERLRCSACGSRNVQIRLSCDFGKTTSHAKNPQAC